MKKINLLLSSMALLSMSVLSPSCKKNIEVSEPQSAAEVSSDAVATKLNVVSVTSPADGPNLVANLIDGKTNTAWSGDNKNVYIPNPNSMYAVFNLGSTMQTVSYIKMAFDVTTQPGIYYEFEIQVSPDGATGWVTVGAYLHNGLNNPYLQTYDFPDTRGRYVRIIGHGNNGPTPKANRWTEVEVYGSAAAASSSVKVNYTAAQVTADNYLAPYVPGNIVDGNLSTYWTGQMSGTKDYKSVTVNLGSVRTIDYVNLSMATGGDPQRMTLFGVSVSTDGVNFTRVISNTWSALDAYAKNKLETFDFPDVAAKYVRVTLNTHTGTYSPVTFNSMNELQIFAAPTATGPLRITSFKLHSEWDYSKVENATCKYNSYGNLDSILLSGDADYFTDGFGGIYSGPTLAFFYDNNQKLSRFERNGGITTTYYTYSNNQIVRDTTVSYVVDPITITDAFVYDSQGRISIQYTKHGAISYPDGGGSPATYDTVYYHYNAAGNQIYAGKTLTYDSHKNFLRTDPTLMFLFHDYSVNNPLTAGGYTTEGYPTGFPGATSKLPYSFFMSSLVTDITYGPAF